MDKLETFKAMLPFIPIGYRRPLLLIIHIEELMRIINSMNECLRMPIDAMDNKPPDMSKMFDILKQNVNAPSSSHVRRNVRRRRLILNYIRFIRT